MRSPPRPSHRPKLPPTLYSALGRCRPAASLLLIATLRSAVPAQAGDAPVRDIGGQPRPSVADSAVERRILGEVNRPAEPPRGLERLTGTIPRHVVTSSLEQALDPGLLRRFGGPGLGLESLHAAVNGDLRAGRRPHVAMALGLAMYGGAEQVKKLRLPHLRVGPAGSGYGITGSFSRLDGGVHVLQPRSVHEGPGRRLLVTLHQLRFPGLPVPRVLRQARFEVEQVTRPSVPEPSLTHVVQVFVPFRIRGARLGMGAGLSFTSTGEQMTRVRMFRPSVTIRRLAVDLDLRQVDLGGSAYLDSTIRASIRPLRVDTRVRQDPWRRRGAVFETRVRATDLMPYVRWLSGES